MSAMITLANAKLGAKGEQDLTRGELQGLWDPDTGHLL
jgi:hypothetical protein